MSLCEFSRSSSCIACFQHGQTSKWDFPLFEVSKLLSDDPKIECIKRSCYWVLSPLRLYAACRSSEIGIDFSAISECNVGHCHWSITLRHKGDVEKVKETMARQDSNRINSNSTLLYSWAMSQEMSRTGQDIITELCILKRLIIQVQAWHNICR